MRTREQQLRDWKARPLGDITSTALNAAPKASQQHKAPQKGKADSATRPHKGKTSQSSGKPRLTTGHQETLLTRLR